MGGKILEYEAKTIMNEGRAEGRKEGGNTMLYVMVQDGDTTPEKGQSAWELRWKNWKRECRQAVISSRKATDIAAADILHGVFWEGKAAVLAALPDFIYKDLF